MIERGNGQAGGFSDWLRWAGALAVLHLVLVLPNRIDAMAATAVLRLPVELPLVALALLLAPRRLRPVARGAIVAALALLVLLKLADMITYAAYGRPFNALVHLHLAAAGWTLLAGAVGTLGAAASVLAVAAVFGAILGAIVWATGVLGRGDGAMRRPGLAAAVALLGLFGGLFAARIGPDHAPAASVQASRLAADHARFLAHSLADAARFRAEMAADLSADIPSERLLAGLRGTDVLLVFVESYGRSTLENPLYAPTALAVLERFEDSLGGTGLAARSAWVTASIYGGQSWLARATFLAGLWIDSQRRYGSLITSDRRTLMHDFRRAGWRTVAVMPAIDRAWPEAEFFGYDRVYAEADLGYAGAPFSWVTMPDQYTLAALHARELAPPRRRPIMAEVALISSHAPWTPIPPLLPWTEIGDGAVFTPYARAGDPPEVVWRDPDRIRAQYLLSIDYVLRTLKSFVARFGHGGMLLILVGDHQPPHFVAGQDSHDVPIHIIGRAALLEALDGWGWTPGMVPDEDAPVWRMDAMRARLLRAFTPEPP